MQWCCKDRVCSIFITLFCSFLLSFFPFCFASSFFLPTFFCCSFFFLLPNKSISTHGEAELQKFIRNRTEPSSEFRSGRRHMPQPQTQFSSQLQPALPSFVSICSAKPLCIFSPSGLVLFSHLLQFKSVCPLQTCCILQDIHCIEVALGVQFLRFANGWGDSILN